MSNPHPDNNNNNNNNARKKRKNDQGNQRKKRRGAADSEDEIYSYFSDENPDVDEMDVDMEGPAILEYYPITFEDVEEDMQRAYLEALAEASEDAESRFLPADASEVQETYMRNLVDQAVKDLGLDETLRILSEENGETLLPGLMYAPRNDVDEPEETLFTIDNIENLDTEFWREYYGVEDEEDQLEQVPSLYAEEEYDPEYVIIDRNLMRFPRTLTDRYPLPLITSLMSFEEQRELFTKMTELPHGVNITAQMGTPHLAKDNAPDEGNVVTLWKFDFNPGIDNPGPLFVIMAEYLEGIVVRQGHPVHLVVRVRWEDPTNWTNAKQRTIIEPEYLIYNSQTLDYYYYYLQEKWLEISSRFSRGQRTQTGVVINDSQDYDMDFITHIEVAMVEHIVVGMCSKNKDVKEEINGMYCVSYKSSNNECLIAICCRRSGRVNHRQTESIAVAQYLNENGIPHVRGEGYALNHVPLVADYFNLHIRVYDEDGNKMIESQDGEDREDVNILFHENHYYDIMSKKVLKDKKKLCEKCNKVYTRDSHNCKQCEKCGVWYSRIHRKCDQTKLAHKQYEHNKHYKNSRVTPNTIFDSEYNSEKDAICYDIETFPSNDGIHKPYAVGWMELNDGTYHVRWGTDCIAKFMDWVIEKGACPKGKKRILFGYNSSGFDNSFILSELMQRGQEPKFTMQDGAIIKINTKYFKVFDLYKFLPGCSLKKACADFRCPQDISKGDFPHMFMDSEEKLDYVGAVPPQNLWPGGKLPDDVDPNDTQWSAKVECKKYLKRDVEATAWLYRTLGKLFYDCFKVNFHKHLTLSAMAYSIWQNMAVKNYNCQNYPFPVPPNPSTTIEIPELDKHVFCRRALYGGRVIVIKRYFSSKYLKDIEEGKVKYDEVDHFLVDCDVVSLYPTAMALFEYPVGESNWVTKEEDVLEYQKLLNDERFEDFPLSIWEIDFKPNKKLMIPVLPHKSFKKTAVEGEEISTNGLKWDLKDRNGVYSSVDIVQAIKAGYWISLKKGLVWNKGEKIFKSYIDVAFKIKQDGEREGNEAKRSVGKISQNALYGKMLQLPIIEDLHIFKSGAHLRKFTAEHTLTDWVYMKNKVETLIFKGKLKSIKKVINKPTQYGVFVLSYSRLWMDRYINLMDEDRFGDKEKSKMNCHYYGDTDSLHKEITSMGEWEKLQRYMKPNELGMLSNNYKPGGKIIEAIYLAPKTYALKVLYPDNKIKVVVKSKGVPTSLLKIDHYFALLKNKSVSEFEISGLKKVGLKNDSTKDDDGNVVEIPPLSIMAHKMKRTLALDLWKGRHFLTDEPTSVSLPFGHEDIPSSEE